MAPAFSYSGFRDLRTARRWARARRTRSCRYCQHELGTIWHERPADWEKVTRPAWVTFERTDFCEACGWFQYEHNEACSPRLTNSLADGILRRFNVDDASAPAEAIISHLRTHQDDLFAIHPRKLEEIVAAIFRDCGLRPELTAYSKDGGIDLYVFRDEGENPLVVQVKRYAKHRRVTLSHIHEFLGAMILADAPAGIYVTTSTFTRPADSAAKEAAFLPRPIHLDLWNADRLFTALELYLHNKPPAYEAFRQEQRQHLWKRVIDLGIFENELRHPNDEDCTSGIDIPMSINELQSGIGERPRSAHRGPSLFDI